MFRTKDFVLVLLSVSFLVLSIGATTWKQNGKTNESENTIELASGDISGEYSAEVYGKGMERERRLAEMRRKVAESGYFSNPTPTIETEVLPVEVEENESDSSVVLSTLQNCSNYRIYTGDWPAKDIVVQESEGARIFYKETGLATSTSHKILAQLPLKPFKLAQPTCVPSDVIGIAKDGSLIRNNEVGLYGVFDANTLIGYALDGNPIYGLSDKGLDGCGGTNLGGQYSYFLSSSRENILNCFVSEPINIGL